MLRILAISLCLATIGCASAGDREDRAPRRSGEERLDAARRGVADAAITPLKDVGLVRPEIPPVLRGLSYPYEVSTLGGSCQRVKYELGMLDAVLGAESYQPGREQLLSERALDAAVGAGVDAAGNVFDVVPLRGLVRRASGATKAQRDAERAIDMGLLRRSFLRGYGAALGCPEVRPAPPPPPDTEDERSEGGR